MRASGEGAGPERLERLERLVREMEAGPESPLRALARRLVAGVLDLHADALRSMVDALRGSAEGRRTLEAWARDSRVAAVLLLHGLHPLPLESRVHHALEALAPILQDHGARVAAVSIVDGHVHVRVEHHGGRIAPPAPVLRARVEEALVGAVPDAAAIEVDVAGPPLGFVPLDEVRLRSRTPEARAG